MSTADLIAEGHRLTVEAAASIAGLRRSNFLSTATPIEIELLHARLDELEDHAQAAAEFSRASMWADYMEDKAVIESRGGDF
jgi:hypothetical protein